MNFSRIICLLWLLVLSACSGQRFYIAPPSVSGEQVWSGIVRIDGDVVVEEEAVVRIAPGTVIVFQNPSPGSDLFTEHPHFAGSELIVKGSLIAEGTAMAPIIFRYADPQAPAGSWGGINLVGSPRAVFRHCRFIQADSAIHSWDSAVEVACSRFENNLVGIRFNASRIRIEHNLLTGNGTAIRFHFGEPVIVGNEIVANDKGFFITAHPEGYRIVENNIVDNREASVVLGEEVPEDVTLIGNYWGRVDSAAIEAGFFDGRRSSYLGKVLYQPFMPLPYRNGDESCVQ